MANVSRKKSTIDRIKFFRPIFWVGELVAPGYAAEVATRWWFQLPGHRRDDAPIGSHVFHLESSAGDVWGYDRGTGPVVYLLHGWGGCSGDFANLAASLVAAGRRVIVIDAPGHGNSGPSPYGPRQASPLHFMAALTAATEKFGPGSIIGHSMGALATAMALRENVRADKVVLIAPVIGGPRLAHRFASALGAGTRTTRRFIAAIEARSRRPLSDFDTAVPPVHTQTLLVHDRGDRHAPFSHGQAIADSWPHAELLPTTGLGHRRVLSAPTVIAQVTEFLSQRSGNQSPISRLADSSESEA